MDDADLARRAQNGDQGAWAQIYDAHADRLHDYCHSILRDRHEAADVLHEAFVTAATKIGQLRDPSRLRPWLYAICRTQSLAAVRRRSREVPDEDAAAMTTPSYDRDTYADTELRELVADAAGGLEPKERAVLFLHLRGGLEGKDLAQALGVTAHHATVMLGRVRDHVERSLSALLVGRTGRAECGDLDALLAEWDGTLSPLIRKRVARHIDRCETCGERRKRMVSPLALLGSFPVIGVPPELREPILDDIALVSATRPLASAPLGRLRAGALAAGLLILAVAGGIVVGWENRGVSGDPVGVASAPESATPTTTVGPTPTSTAPTTPATPPRRSDVAGSSGTPTPVPGVETPQTRTSTVPSSPAPDPRPPAVTDLRTDSAWISPSDRACRTTTASARVVDDDVAAVTLVWRQGSGREHPVGMRGGEGDVYTATIGPVAGVDAGPVTWWVTAVDAGGLSTTSPQQLLRVADTCPAQR